MIRNTDFCDPLSNSHVLCKRYLIVISETIKKKSSHVTSEVPKIMLYETGCNFQTYKRKMPENNTGVYNHFSHAEIFWFLILPQNQMDKGKWKREKKNNPKVQTKRKNCKVRVERDRDIFILPSTKLS